MKKSKVNEDTSVHVAVRVRPMLPKERLENCQECIRVDTSINQVIIGSNRSFCYDYVFDQQAKQREVFETCIKQLVDSFFEGYNATVFAYGQTGSGKTFTMGSTDCSDLSEEEIGAIPRIIKRVFEIIEEKKNSENSVEFMLRVSFLEIYKETIKDLLNPQTDSKQIHIREDEKKGIVVVGVKEEVVTSYEEMQRALQVGTLHRTTGSTLMNEHSSRSHAIFTITIEQRILPKDNNIPKEAEDAGAEYIMAKFHLVDLAGSERNKKTGAVGIRFKEAVTINGGLLALGNVISALGDPKKRLKVTHVPYRDSKLTRLLQDSLGGNSKTLMIACVSPTDSSFQESLSTLQYAHRARNIKNKPVINRDPNSALLATLRSQIKQLQLELLKHKMEKGENPDSSSNITLEELLKNEEVKKYIAELQMKSMGITNEKNNELLSAREQNEMLSQKSKDLEQQLDEAHRHVTELSETMFILKQERDRFHVKLRECYAQLNEAALHMKKIDDNVKDLSPEDRKTLRDFVNRIANQNPVKELQKTQVTIKRPQTAPLPKQTNEYTEDERSQNRALSSSVTVPFEVEPLQVIARQSKTIKQLEEELVQTQIKLNDVQQELQEAKDDLSRDERIFADKIREIKKLSKTVQALQQENMELQDSLINERNHVRELENYINKVIENGSIPKDLPTPSLSPETKIEMIKKKSMELQVEDIENSQPVQENAKPLNSVEVNTDIDLSNQIEEEKSRIEEEKRKIEQEKELIERQIREQQRAFRKSQKILEKNLKDLTLKIRFKESLIRDLIKSEHESQVIKQQYEERIAMMEEEMRTTQVELEKMMKNIEAIDMDKNKKEQEIKRIQEAYRIKMKQMEQELITLRKQQADKERLIKEKYRSDKRVKELEVEIAKMKQQKEYLRLKIKESKEKQEQANTEKGRQIAVLKKEAEDGQRKIRLLESENYKQKLILEKKTKEIEMYQQKLSPHVKASRFLNTEIDKQKAWLDREIEKYIKKKEGMERLERELKKREAILKEKELMIARKQALEKKRLRDSQVAQQSIVGLTKQIEMLNREIEKLRSKILRKDNTEQQEEDIREQLNELLHQKERAQLQKTKLEEKSKTQQFHEEEALRQIEEQTEVLDAEIEYKTEAIQQAERLIKAEEDNYMMQLIENINLDEARNLLKKYFEKVVELKSMDNKKNAKIQELEVILADKEKQCMTLQNNVRLTRMLLERKLAKVQKEYELRIQALMKQASMGPKPTIDTSITSLENELRLKEEKILTLDKDNYYYKQTNRDLKHKLREIVALHEEERKRSEMEREELQLLRKQNASLMNELQNLKNYLQTQHSQNVLQVRKSMKDLRQISEEDVLKKMIKIQPNL